MKITNLNKYMVKYTVPQFPFSMKRVVFLRVTVWRIRSVNCSLVPQWSLWHV